ncbi:MAG: acyltransferase family protein [Breznakibacter sp.]
MNKRIAKVSFFAIVLVVFIHAYNANLVVDNQAVKGTSPLVWFIESLIGDGFARVAVPLFFFISGIRFYYGIDGRFDTVVYRNKLLKRSISVAGPFVKWSTLGMAIVFLLQTIPFSAPFFNSMLLRDMSIRKLLSIWILDPLPYQLWFMQVLFCMAVLSPLFWRLIQLKLPTFFIVTGCLVLWYFKGGYNGWPEYFFEGMAFFMLGAVVSIRQIDIMQYRGHWLLLMLWATLVVAKIWLIFVHQPSLALVTGKLSIMIGMVAVWSMIDGWQSGSRYFEILLSQTFFIYLSHEPLLTITKKLLLSDFSPLQGRLLIVYFMAPVLSIAVCLMSGWILKAYVPRLHSWLTGGR